MLKWDFFLWFSNTVHWRCHECTSSFCLIIIANDILEMLSLELLLFWLLISLNGLTLENLENILYSVVLHFIPCAIYQNFPGLKSVIQQTSREGPSGFWKHRVNFLHRPTVVENYSKLSHFEFWHFPLIFVLLKLTCLVTLIDCKIEVFKNLAKLIILAVPPIFVLLKMSCLVTLFDRKFQVFENSP